MEPHEFTCADCGVYVYAFGGDKHAKLCSACQTIREIKERTPLTPEDEKRVREMLGNVRPITWCP